MGRRPKNYKLENGDINMAETAVAVKNMIVSIAKSGMSNPMEGTMSIAELDMLLTEYYMRGYVLTGHPQYIAEATTAYVVLYVLHKV